jgi:hypothetical protein
VARGDDAPRHRGRAMVHDRGRPGARGSVCVATEVVLHPRRQPIRLPHDRGELEDGRYLHTLGPARRR